VNQIGTLSETLEAMRRAREGGYAAVVSQPLGRDRGRDDRDLAVGTGCGQDQDRLASRARRVAKYNRRSRSSRARRAAVYAGRAKLARRSA